MDANSFQLEQGLEWVLQNDVRDDVHHDGVVEGHNDPLEEGVVGLRPFMNLLLQLLLLLVIFMNIHLLDVQVMEINN